MPQQHFTCDTCGTSGLYPYTVADVGGPDWPPACPYCLDGTLRQTPRPGDFAMDLRSDSGTGPFQKFTVARLGPDGAHHEEVIDSLHKVRQIERDSEQRYRDGEGEPLRFRAFSQSASNRDVGSFGREGRIGDRTYDSGQAPARSGRVGLKRHGQTKPTIPLGPGLRRATTALKG